MSRPSFNPAWVGATCTVLGLLGGATATWARTDGALRTHLATSKIRVRQMCQVAEFQVRAMERICEANGISCVRPVELRTEVLGQTCEEP